jgi:hypothetical protein
MSKSPSKTPPFGGVRPLGSNSAPGKDHFGRSNPPVNLDRKVTESPRVSEHFKGLVKGDK